MTDHYIAGLESTVRELRRTIARLEEDKAHLDQIVGQQSTRLEQQTRTLAAVREACGRLSFVATTGEGIVAEGVQVLDIFKALNGDAE